MIQVEGISCVRSFAELALVALKLVILSNLVKLVIESHAAIRITDNVLAEATDSAVLSPDVLILSMQVAFPYEVLIALAR